MSKRRKMNRCANQGRSLTGEEFELRGAELEDQWQKAAGNPVPAGLWLRGRNRKLHRPNSKKVKGPQQIERGPQQPKTSPPEMRKCEAVDDDICRALYCPRHRRRLAYCPWEKNGYTRRSAPF